MIGLRGKELVNAIDKEWRLAYAEFFGEDIQDSDKDDHFNAGFLACLELIKSITDDYGPVVLNTDDIVALENRLRQLQKGEGVDV